MNQPLIDAETSPNERTAKLLEQMAARIRRNAGDDFGGCFVVVPPDGSGEPFQYMGLDSSKDPVLFYQLLSSRLKAVLDGLDSNLRAQSMRR